MHRGGRGGLLGATASGGGARTCSWHIIPDITIVLPDIRVVLMVNSHTWSHNISHVLLLTWSWYLHPNISKCESGWELLQVSRPWMLENHLTITSSRKCSGNTSVFFRCCPCLAVVFSLLVFLWKLWGNYFQLCSCLCYLLQVNFSLRRSSLFDWGWGWDQKLIRLGRNPNRFAKKLRLNVKRDLQLSYLRGNQNGSRNVSQDF